MGGMLQPIGGQLPGRVMADIATLGLAEALPSNIRDPLYNTTGSIFFSPASGLAAGGAGLLGAGGISGGGFGAAAPSAAGIGMPAAGSSIISGANLPQNAGGQVMGGVTPPPVTPPPNAPSMSKSDMLQNAFLATSVGGMLGNAIRPQPLPPANFPSAPIGSGGGFTPVATNASQQWAQLMAQRRAQQMGKFTV